MNETLPAAELQNILANKHPVRMLDVRRQADFDADPVMITGATWHNPDEVEQWGDALPPNEDIVIYCARGGSVSKSVLAALRTKNLSVRYLEGGLVGWRAAAEKTVLP